MYTVQGPEEESDSSQTMRGVVGGTKLFNRFALQRVLGRGGMGVVWLALDERLERQVALKLVPESVAFDAADREDLKRETRKSLLLTHPYIVRIFDFLEDEHSAAISMEYVDGSTLSSLRVKRPAKCFEVEEITPWVLALCDALTYAHGTANVVHRDLKPGNLMVNSRGELKVTDFGIACTLRNSMTYVSMRTSSGTLNYMSPEQLLGGDPSAADDIYSVGATLYELLSGKPPFFGGDVATQVRTVIAPTIAQRRAKLGVSGAPIPKYWEETIAACLAKEPEKRPQNAAEIARRLRLGHTVGIRSEQNEDRKNFLTKHRVPLSIAAGVLVAISIGLFSRPRAKEKARIVADKVVVPEAFAMEKSAVTPPVSKPPIPSATVGSVAIRPAAPPAANSVATAPAGSLHVTTNPSGASFSIYPGVIAGKAAPDAKPWRNGVAPEDISDVPPGRYTLFFSSPGWPEYRAEISVSSTESVPIDYTFPQGTAEITSAPAGADVFYGEHSLGVTPLTAILPLGKLKLVARLEHFSEQSETATIDSNRDTKIAFQMTRRRSHKAKPTPTPSAFDKIGQTLKHVFGGKPAPTPHKKH